MTGSSTPFTEAPGQAAIWLVPWACLFGPAAHLAGRTGVPLGFRQGRILFYLFLYFFQVLSSFVTQPNVLYCMCIHTSQGLVVAMLLPRRQDLLGAWGWMSQYTRPPDWYRAWSELPCGVTVTIFEFVLAAHKRGSEPPLGRWLSSPQLYH